MSGDLSNDSVVTLRAGVEGDRSYVMATWLNNFYMSRMARMMDRPLYFFEQKKVAERLLKRARLIVASNTENPDHIFGWVVGERAEDLPDGGYSIVDYCFVKSDYRELGVGRALVDAITSGSSKVFFTHLPPAEQAQSRDGSRPRSSPGEIVQKLAPGSVFNFYLASR